MILSSQLLIPVRRALRKSAMWGSGSHHRKGPGYETISLLPSKLTRNFTSKPEQSKFF